MHVVDNTGWHFDYIESLTIPKLMMMLKHWNENPSVPLLVRNYFGIKPKTKINENQTKTFLNDINKEKDKITSYKLTDSISSF